MRIRKQIIVNATIVITLFISVIQLRAYANASNHTSSHGAESPSPLDPPCCVSPGKFLGNEFTMKWGRAKNAVIYDVYRSGSEDGEYSLIDSVNIEKFVDPGITKKDFCAKKETYFYKISSKDDHDKSSAQSKPYKIDPDDYCNGSGSSTTLQDNQLKIKRTKEVLSYMPTGENDSTHSVFSVKFLNDKKRRVFTDPFSKSVKIIDENGKQIMTIGKVGPGEDQMGAPYSLTTDVDNNVYISDSVKTNKLFSYNRYGQLRYVADLHIPVELGASTKNATDNPLDKCSICGMAIRGAMLYAADKNSGTCQIYNKNTGKFIDYLRDKKTGKILNFGEPGCLLINDEGLLFVARTDKNEIAVVDVNTGKIVRNIGGKSNNFIGSFSSIIGMDFDRDGNLVVADPMMQSIQVFDKNGKYLYHIGGEVASADPQSKGQRPHIKNIGKPCFPMIDAQGKLHLYNGSNFVVREFIDDNIWDVAREIPE